MVRTPMVVRRLIDYTFTDPSLAEALALATAHVRPIQSPLQVVNVVVAPAGNQWAVTVLVLNPIITIG